MSQLTMEMVPSNVTQKVEISNLAKEGFDEAFAYMRDQPRPFNVGDNVILSADHVQEPYKGQRQIIVGELTEYDLFKGLLQGDRWAIDFFTMIHAGNGGGRAYLCWAEGEESACPMFAEWLTPA